MTAAQRVGDFEALRPHLTAVAYRLTGTVADAEDVVQDAWLRWDAVIGRDAEPIADLRAWLTTVVSRLALDRLRSAARRRETYFGEWLPEPVVTDVDGSDPLSAMVSHEDARFVAMVVLQRLSPDQRVAFVLHDGFSVPFAEIAGVLNTSVASARQLASRARRAVADATPAPDAAHAEVVGRLLAAMAAGDMSAVIALLHSDVTFTGDSDRKAPTAFHVIKGSDKVARFMFGLARRYGPAWLESNRLALVNGELGAYTPGAPGRDGYPPVLPRVIAITVRDRKIYAMWDVANPDKFTGSPLCPDALRASAHRSPDALRAGAHRSPPTEPGTRHRN